ncbi:MAG: hypothetical protein MRK01_17010 [Candidatus Scalindua sp.]|nr:hypothetical protein [Candidatus Scalindua sp.]
MNKRILISIMLVCVFGCGNEHMKERIQELEDEKQNTHLQLQEQRTRLEATTDVIDAVTSLINSIHETELKIDDKKQILFDVDALEKTAGAKDEILSDIEELYDALKIHRQRADELQKKLDSFADSNNQTNESLSSLKAVIKEKTSTIDTLENNIDILKSQIAHLENLQGELSNQINSYTELAKEKNSKISYLKNELVSKEQVLSKKELEITTLKDEINTIYYIIGDSEELIERGIVAKRGIPIISKLNPFSKSYALGPNCSSSKFKQEKKTKTIYRMSGKIKAILPYRDKEYYDVYYEDNVSVINIKDPRNFWYVKFLIIATN